MKYLHVCLYLILGCLVFTSCVTPDAYQYGKFGSAGIINKSEEIKDAREALIDRDIPGAIAGYRKAISADTPEPVDLAEFAYALALGGFYDAALANLDRARILDPDAIEVYYFGAQVLYVMGLNDIADDLWPRALRKQTPGWIRVDADNLNADLKKKIVHSKIENGPAELSKGNTLIAKRCFFQAVIVFNEITTQYPSLYLPYVGYSVAVEKIGAQNVAVAILRKAQDLAKDENADRSMQRLVRDRISELNTTINSNSAAELKTADALGLASINKSQGMVYLGGALGSGSMDINFRLGSYKQDKSDVGLTLGLVNGGLSFGVMTNSMSRAKNSSLGFLYGVGIRIAPNGFSYIYNIGLYAPVGKGGGRFDYLLNFEMFYTDISADPVFYMSFTLGVSTFFGKR